MKLIECYIENFGTISGEHIVFDDGLNCIKKDNGTGKTTLTVFLKAMLYGLSDTRKVGLDENERKHYLPWQSGVFGGSLTFAARGGTYRVERRFSARPAEDTFALYDVKKGSISTDFPENIGEALFGIDADGFERTVFLSERGLSPKTDNKSIAAKLSDLVGTDGDIGVMDDAMKVLEVQRKLYAKKGGGGKITDTRTELAGVERELCELELLRASMPEKGRRLSDATKRLSDMEEAARLLAKEHAEATMRESASEYESRYERMKLELSHAEERRRELYEFFGGRIPTFREVEEAAYRHERANQIKSQNVSDGGSELDEQKKRFARATAEKAEELREATVRIRALEQAIGDEKFAELAETAGAFPTADKLDELKSRANKAENKGINIPIAACGTVLSAVLLVLGFVVHAVFIGFAAAAIIITAGILMLQNIGAKKRKTSLASELDGIFTVVMPSRCPISVTDIGLRLEELHGLTRLYSERAEIIGKLNSARADTARILSEFCTDEVTAEDAEHILADYERYTEKLRIANYRKEEAEKDDHLAASLIRQVDEFLHGIKVTESEPFEQIRRALSEYTRLLEETAAKRTELENYRALHGVGAKQKSGPSVAEIDMKRGELDARRREASEEVALLRREYDRAELTLSEIDGLRAKKEELVERLDKYERTLDIILLTQKYLTAAKDSMTSKYLGKTKAAFEKYMSLISGEAGEYDMATDFGIAKREGGSTKVAEYYSKGTRDLFDLCARLALVDALYESEKPFLVLDDPFMSFDDKRLTAAKKLLSRLSAEKQIIYFTCAESRASGI